jgi:hypothetical protein
MRASARTDGTGSRCAGVIALLGRLQMAVQGRPADIHGAAVAGSPGASETTVPTRSLPNGRCRCAVIAPTHCASLPTGGRWRVSSKVCWWARCGG